MKIHLQFVRNIFKSENKLLRAVMFGMKDKPGSIPTIKLLLVQLTFLISPSTTRNASLLPNLPGLSTTNTFII